jgi:hypothetical protein
VPDGDLLQRIPYAVEALLAQYLHEAEERCLLNGSYPRGFAFGTLLSFPSLQKRIATTEDISSLARMGLTRFRGLIRVKRSGSVKGVEEDGQDRQAVSA